MKVNLTDTQKAIAVVAARIVVPLAAVVVTDIVIKKITKTEATAE
jgi:hypothetical protein